MHCISASLGNLGRLCRARTLSLAFTSHRRNPGLLAMQRMAWSIFFVINAIPMKMGDALHPPRLKIRLPTFKLIFEVRLLLLNFILIHQMHRHCCLLDVGGSPHLSLNDEY